MTKNSFICNFINENPYDWKEKLSKNPYFLKIKEENGLAIFNYNIIAFEIIKEATETEPPVVARTNFNLPITQEARGIIIDVDKREVVCWPFRKFGNIKESYIDTIDWNSACVQEKIDGSIMKVWFNKKTNKWQVSSNATIDALENSNTKWLNYGEIFNEAASGVLDYSILDTDYTYIFELVDPRIPIVIKYDETKIYHLGTRSNITGQEVEVDIGVEKPKTYPLKSLDECLKVVTTLNKFNEKTNVFDIFHEGFVVKDKDYHRVKIKAPEYVTVHALSTVKIVSLEKIINLVEENEVEEFCAYYPKHKEMITDVQNKYYTILGYLNKYLSYLNDMFEKVGHDRKELFAIIGKDKLSGVANACIFYGKSIEEYFSELSIKNKRFLLDNCYELDKLTKSFTEFKQSQSIER